MNVGRPSVGGDHLLFVRTLMIVIVNSDTTFLSHPAPFPITISN
jgi:hypothetical protein